MVNESHKMQLLIDFSTRLQKYNRRRGTVYSTCQSRGVDVNFVFLESQDYAEPVSSLVLH
jgi:hypothetical protein